MIFEVVGNVVDRTGNLNDFVLKPIAASEAFRKYNWLQGAAVLNRSGDLRGMVINARIRTIYDLSVKTGDRLLLLSMLVEIGKETSRIRRVYNSDADASEKVSRILLLSSAAILRSVSSVVPTAVHLLAMSTQGYVQLYSRLTNSSSGDALNAEINKVDQQVSAIHARQWDGEVWYNVIVATVQ